MRLHNLQEGTVCDDGFNDISATVICREMGYKHGISYTWGTDYGITAWDIQESYPIVLDDINCTDPDLTFSNCSYDSPDTRDYHWEDVFLYCSESEQGNRSVILK